MLEALPIIVLGTSIWVLFDANKMGIHKGVWPGNCDYGPGEWFFFCLLLWIVGFPLYLSRRGKYSELLSSGNGTQKKCPFCAEVINEEAIKCKHCGSMMKDALPSATSSTGTVARTPRPQTSARRVSSKNARPSFSIGRIILIVLGTIVAFYLVMLFLVSRS